ncbi:MAG TPA: carboxypeptidase regulatory-like domain-containing protein, partial [Polyangia bacterium]|nr:carboxypeptidase regulatory-like domain-containing protein [Polyangia bacterium]
MTTTHKLAKLLLVAALAAAPRAAHAVGETNGRIGGTVMEQQTSAPVPGATVTASGPALIGGPRAVSTDENGRYEIVQLPPGAYTVEVSYSGVKPLRRKVVVRQGELLPLDIAWSAELAETETTVIVEERHLTKPDSTQTGTVVSADTSSKVATPRD